MKRQTGFTLVEIAIVLVIIGLLLGGILKGQELINSARVRNLADTSTGIQAAYYGFVDRYRRVPGDWDATSAELAIGQSITGGGNNNGRIDTAGGSVPGAPWQEVNALWEQLADAGFIAGDYPGDPTAPTTTNGYAPLNAYNNVMAVGRSNQFLGAGAADRLHLVIGRGVPASVMRELDVKLDDGIPDRGDLRGTLSPGGGPDLGTVAEQEAACIDAGPPVIWDVISDSQDCNGIYIF